MADVETKLRWLSERGSAMGADELILRIEAELAGSPMVVMPDGGAETVVDKSRERRVTRRPTRHRFGWAPAVAAAVLAVAGLDLVLDGNRDPVADDPSRPALAEPDAGSMTDLEAIQAGVEAFYSGDVERAVELFELPAPHDDDWIRRESRYQALIGGRLDLNCTELVEPGAFSCLGPYHNVFTDAIGWVDTPGDQIRISVVGGVITQFGFPVHSFLEGGLAEFLAESGSGDPDCGVEHLTDCALVVLGEVDAWAAWAEANLVRPTNVPVPVAQAGVEALYSGDADRAAELFELADRDDDEIRRLTAYEAAIYGRVALTCWRRGGPGRFDCYAVYRNALTDTIGAFPPGDMFEVAVENGVITQFEFPEHTYLLNAVVDYLDSEGETNCANEFDWDARNQGAVAPPPDCVGVILARLDDWAAWYKTNGDND